MIFTPRRLITILALAAVGCLPLSGQDAPEPEMETEAAVSAPVPKRVFIAALSPVGDPEYHDDWKATADAVREVGELDKGLTVHLFGAEDGFPGTTREELLGALAEVTPEDELWLFLSGHGTWDGRLARFNLQGTDVSDLELAGLLKDRTGPTVVVVATAGSAPFIRSLSGPGRVVVAATKSGDEINYVRFGKFFAQALADTEADLDEDGQTSLLEASLMASIKVAEFYDVEGRLATEHAMLDDNGDRLATRTDWFRGVRAIRAPRDKVEADGVRAHQLHLVPSELERQFTLEERARRDVLEQKIFVLRDQKGEMEAARYYGSLEPLLLEIGKLYAAAELRLAEMTAENR